LLHLIQSMSIRAAAPIQREQWLLPLTVAVLVAALELLRSRGTPIPGGGLLPLFIVVFTAYRAGTASAFIGAGCLSLYVILGANSGMQLPFWVVIAALFGMTLLVGWLSARQRTAIADANYAREAAQRVENRYRELLDGVDAVVWEADADTFSVRFVSKQAESLFGYSVSEWVGSPQIWQRLIHPDDFQSTLTECREAVRGNRDHDLEYRVITRAGNVLHVRDIVQIDRSVSPPILRGILLDITREHMAHVALQDTERKLRAFINNAPDPLLVNDGEGRILEVNERACEALGYTREELLNLRIYDIDLTLTEERVRADVERLARERITVEGLFRRKDGTTFPTEISLGMWDSGQPQLFVAIARDITRKSQLETQLRHAQRMEAVGRLAGGIAHDFNNLLTAIKGHADLLRNEVGNHLRADIDEIGQAADRAASLTHQLLAYSRQQVLQLQVLDLNSVVTDMQKLLVRLIGEDIVLITVLEPGVPAIEADRTQLEQVLMNLVLNARDAMPEGGKLRVRTAQAVLTEVDADRFPFVLPGRYVLLTVTDDGIGMDADTQARIYDPFFTTKDQGKGSGLGLATAYGIVKQMGGYIWCESEPGIGTTFRVYLPPARLGSEPAATDSRPGRVTISSGNETILVVEDEPSVRSLVRRVLVKCGYHVLDAANGVEALALVSGFEQPIHLLLTDVIMPEMGGRDLAEQLAPNRPGMKILYMSGYAEDAIVVNHVLQPGFAFLPKPFAPDALTAKVREALES
jgi:two-component system, cell cycle sensor histidine kinase and response regulator CckA